MYDEGEGSFDWWNGNGFIGVTAFAVLSLHIREVQFAIMKLHVDRSF